MAERGVAILLAEVEAQQEENYRLFKQRAGAFAVTSGMGHEGAKLVGNQKDLILMKEILSTWDTP